MSCTGAQLRRPLGRRSGPRTAATRWSRPTITVLAAQGERATMTAICHQAGLTERYFYESFANRDAALVAALDQVTDEIASDCDPACSRPPAAPPRSGCTR